MEKKSIVYGELRSYEYLPVAGKIRYACRHDLYRDITGKYIIKLLPGVENDVREKIHRLMEFQARFLNRETEYLFSAFPLEAVFRGTSRRPEQWAGYVMRDCTDVHMEVVSARPTAFAAKFGPYYQNLLLMCYTLCQCMDFFHRYGILLSDIKPSNFFVTSELFVYPIDTDGFSVPLKQGDGSRVQSASQIPQPAFRLNSDFPGGADYFRYAQTPKAERYSLAVLLLELLTSQDFTEPAEIRTLQSYNLTANSSSIRDAAESLPKQISRKRMMFYKLWYAMPQDFRDIFLSVIHGTCERGATRLPSANEWMYIIWDFIRYLDGAEKTRLFPPEKLEMEGFRTQWNVSRMGKDATHGDN